MYRAEFATAPGKKTVIEVQDGLMTAATIQDCVPIAEEMKALHNAGEFGSSDMKYCGRIPDVFVEKYCNDNGITYTEFLQNREHVRRLINDPALSHFRVWPGRV